MSLFHKAERQWQRMLWLDYAGSSGSLCSQWGTLEGKFKGPVISCISSVLSAVGSNELNIQQPLRPRSRVTGFLSNEHTSQGLQRLLKWFIQQPHTLHMEYALPLFKVEERRANCFCSFYKGEKKASVFLRVQQHVCATKAVTSDIYGAMHNTDCFHIAL